MDFDMIWTAILKRGDITSACTFTADNNPEEAYRSIWKVLMADGYEILGVIKGNQSQTFYGIDLEKNRVRNAVPVDVPSNLNGV